MPRFEPLKPTASRLQDLPKDDSEPMEIGSGAEQWLFYAEAYKEAADALADKASRDSYTLRVVGAPMLFLYRHYIELHLKSLLLDAGELLDDPQTVPPMHYLLQLWRRVRPLLHRVSPISGDPWFKRADDVIRQFDQIDPSSFAFRYPVKRSGAPSLGAPLVVDPKNVRRMIAELHVILSGSSAQIDEFSSFKNEPF